MFSPCFVPISTTDSTTKNTKNTNNTKSVGIVTVSVQATPMPLYTTLHCIGPEAPKSGEQGNLFSCGGSFDNKIRFFANMFYFSTTRFCFSTTIGIFLVVMFQIMDDGPGFSVDAMANLFEPFFTTKTCVLLFSCIFILHIVCIVCIVCVDTL